MNLIFLETVGAQPEQWFRDALASSTVDFDTTITSTVTVTVVTEPSGVGHSDFMCTSEVAGGFLIEIRRGIDDAAAPLNAGLPGPVRLFFMETVIHELAHCLQRQNNPSDEQKTALCALFTRTSPTGSIGQVGTLADWAAGAWEDHIDEAVAETLKDAALPDLRVYDNRTNWQTSEANFSALMTLVIGSAGGTVTFSDDFATDSSALYVDPTNAVWV